MFNFNQVLLAGRLVEKPRQVKIDLPSGGKAAGIVLAENSGSRRDKLGRPTGNFIPITLMGSAAEIALRRALKSGQQVSVTGFLTHDKFKSVRIENALQTINRLLEDNPEAKNALNALRGLEWRNNTVVRVNKVEYGYAPPPKNIRETKTFPAGEESTEPAPSDPTRSE